MSQPHPWWYYKYYDMVFSRHANYEGESRLISKGKSIQGRLGKEIGAGLGGHSDFFVENLKELHLFDIDTEATSYLHTKYQNHPNVIVREGDGFIEKTRDKYDIVFCMYSVLLLGVEELSTAVKRARSVYRSLKPGGRFAFEIIDIEKNKLVHPHQRSHLLFRSPLGKLFVKTTYELGRFSIDYSGELEGMPVTYRVSYIDVTLPSLIEAIQSQVGTAIKAIPIDTEKRRWLGYLEKPC